MLPERPQSLRILYVEDNELVREITSELLSRDSREIHAVGTAEEALEAFARDPFDIIVTDLSLPGMSGIDFAREILRLDPTAPIILATGYELQVDVLLLGPRVRAITKPFDAPQLDRLIDELSVDELGADAAP